MTYPTKYSRQYDFQSYQVSNPTRPLPGNRVNVDLNAVVTSIDEVVEFLKTSIRADGRLANGSVGVNQLDATFDLGFSLPTTWEAGVAYTTDSTVFHDNKFYKANVAHNSTDGFDESKWDLIVDFGEQATAAAASATAAAASETAAATSATNAATSAATATTQATAASASATAAATSETNAATSATNAAASAAAAAAAPPFDPTLATFTQTGTGAVGRSVTSKLTDSVHVKDFGAVCDGTTDDTAAIQAALDTGKAVILPAGTCKITGALNITVSGTCLLGAGWQTSNLTSDSTTGPMVTVADAVIGVVLSGFCLTRSVTAGVFADGIHFLGRTERTHISDIFVEKQYNGITLRTTSYSVVREIITQGNENDGLAILATAASSTLQWYISDVLSQANGNRGMLVSSAVGTVGCSLGSWTGILTFGNSGFGVAVVGTATSPINGIRLFDSFIGEDGNSEIYLDTYGSYHQIGDTFIELCGTGATGPALTTPASGVGHGVHVTTNNNDVKITNVLSNGNSQAGFKLDATTQRTSISNCRGSNNGTYGLEGADGTKLSVNGCDFEQGNTSGKFAIASNGLSTVGSGNWPIIHPSATASLGADVALNNVSNYFDGPSITLGAGTWLVTGRVVLQDTSGPAGCRAKLWDGTNVIDSAAATIPAANYMVPVALSGILSCVNGTVVKISAMDSGSTSGKIIFNGSGNSKDSTISAIRIG